MRVNVRWFHLVVTAICLLPLRLAGAEFTFFSCSDTHYEETGELNADRFAGVEMINSLPGAAWPAELGGGTVQEPLGVLVLGDLIDDGAVREKRDAQFGFWLRDFGVKGEGRLRFPVYEGFGNHDLSPERIVQQKIIERNRLRPGLTAVSDNGLHYSWDWQGIHFVQLNLYPGDEWQKESKYGPAHDPEDALKFLVADLARHVGSSGRPVFLAHHYDPRDDWWLDGEKAAYYTAIKGYNILGIIHGHTGTGIYQWNGIDVFNDGNLPGGGAFVFRITADDLLQVGQFTPEKKWRLTFSKKFAWKGPAADQQADPGRLAELTGPAGETSFLGQFRTPPAAAVENAPDGLKAGMSATNPAAAVWAASSETFATARDFGAWKHRMRIRFTGCDRPAPLKDFPALIVLDEARGGFRYDQCVGAGGADLRFSDEQGSELAHEIEAWRPGGRSFVWVKVPLLAGPGTSIVAHWGNPDPALAAETAQPERVWSGGFAGVWHMAEPDARDALGRNHGRGGGNSSTEGVISGAQQFPAEGKPVIEVRTVTDDLQISGQFTVSAWVKPLSQTDSLGIVTKGEGWGEFNLHLKAGGRPSLELKPFLPDAGSAPVGPNGLASGTWHHVAATWDGAEARIFVNGREEAHKAGQGTIEPRSRRLRFGAIENRHLPCVLDEVRISSVARPADWFRACWMNQSNPAEFLDYEAIE